MGAPRVCHPLSQHAPVRGRRAAHAGTLCRAAHCGDAAAWPQARARSCRAPLFCQAPLPRALLVRTSTSPPPPSCTLPSPLFLPTSACCSCCAVLKHGAADGAGEERHGGLSARLHMCAQPHLRASVRHDMCTARCSPCPRLCIQPTVLPWPCAPVQATALLQPRKRSWQRECRRCSMRLRALRPRTRRRRRALPVRRRPAPSQAARCKKQGLHARRPVRSGQQRRC